MEEEEEEKDVDPKIKDKLSKMDAAMIIYPKILK
jgi:hypothetical protein